LGNEASGRQLILARKGVNKQQIFEIAKEIAFSNNQLPTAISIRDKLATGSMATIQKYLQEWKMDCIKKACLNKELNVFSTYIPNRINESDEKNRSLEQSLSKQVKKNEYYAQELISVEKTNVELKEENRQLNFTNQELQLKLSTAEKTNNALEQVTQKLQHELNLNINATIQKMQQTIDDLRLELKTLNETSINALRETSNQGHQALMQERVVSINLQAKIDSLTKELSENKKQLHEAIMTAQVQNRSLLRQNEQLQKIIQEYGFDKLPQLDQGANLQFSKQVAIYGK
jgi:chromosome segregation ATPase